MARTALFRLLRRALVVSDVHPAQGRKRAWSVRSPRWPRRRFLQLMALMGGATATHSVFPLQVYSQDQPRITVVGGGIAGLNAAYQLKKLGFSATVYEAKPILGGRIQSRAVVERALINDLGGVFINTDHEDILALVDELNLTLFSRYENLVTTIPPSAFYFNGQAFSEAEIADQLRPLALQINQDAELLEADFDTYVEVFDGLSVKDYLDQHQDKIPSPWIRTLVEAGIRTEYGVEAGESSALQLIYNLPTVTDNEVEPISSDEAYTLEGGSAQLIRALAEALPDQIQTRAILRQLEAQEQGYRLTFERAVGQVETIESEYVILALPFTALRRVKLQVQLPEALQRFIQEITLGRNEKVFAGFRERAWQIESGFSLEAWTDLGFSQLWDDTQRQSDQPRGVLTYFLGGDEVAITQGNSSLRGPDFSAQFDRWVPGVEAAQTGRYHRTYWTEDPFVGGGYTSFRPGQYLEFSEFLYIESEDPDERVDVHVGNLVFAGEHLSDEYYGYMNGGAQTGRLAAEVVATLIQG